MGACLGKNNNVTIRDLKKDFNSENNSSTLKSKKYLSSPSLDYQFRELNIIKYANPIVSSENNPNILDITDVRSDDSNIYYNNDSFKEILELFN